MRNKVAALLAEKPKADLDTIAIAALMADAARKQAPDQPWGALARLDIARHLRRADLLATSRSDLQPFAATNEAAHAALADDRIGRAPAWVWLLRVLALLGLAFTAVHALRHRSGTTKDKASSASQPAAALIVLVSLLLSSSSAAAPPAGIPQPEMKDGQLSHFKIDPEHPEAAVEKLLQSTKDPLELGYLLQDLAAFEAAAERKDDKPAQVRYYHAMALAAPTAFAPRRECQVLESMGDIPAAIVACREVLIRAGNVVDDYVHFVDLVLANPMPLPAREPDELENVIVHFEKEVKTPGNLPVVMRCKVAMRFEDRAALDKCRAAMSTAPADDPTVISIKWGLAVRDHDREGALALVEQARKAGLDPLKLQSMTQTTNAMAGQRRQRARIFGSFAIMCVAFAIVGARALANRRRSAPRSPA